MDPTKMYKQIMYVGTGYLSKYTSSFCYNFSKIGCYFSKPFFAVFEQKSSVALSFFTKNDAMSTRKERPALSQIMWDSLFSIEHN